MPAEGKIKSKDLSYESTLPPFLQRLHAQKAGQGDSDRHERGIARPKRVKTNDEDDGPTMVDESGDTVSKEEYEKLTTAATEEDANVTGELQASEPKASGALQDGEATAQQKVTDGTATKKRKVGKVVGDDDDPESKKDEERTKNVTKKAKKKAKPIKLAFNDDENEDT